jgi:thioredoxin-related protein
LQPKAEATSYKLQASSFKRQQNINMKRIFVLLLAVALPFLVLSQDLSTFRLYNPADNASASIAAAVKKAKAERKHVFIQIGGNWCIWCARFNDLVTKDAGIDSVLKSNYVVYHLNHSKENRNERLLAKYDYPQRFGFPVFLILDATGKRMHTQNSGYLEQDKGYNVEKVKAFFADWAPAALDPKQYKEQ